MKKETNLGKDGWSFVFNIWSGIMWGILFAFLFGGILELGRYIFYPRPDYATQIRIITKDPTYQRTGK